MNTGVRTHQKHKHTNTRACIQSLCSSPSVIYTNIGTEKVSTMIYTCNYPAAEFETQTRSVVVNNSDGCVFLCAYRMCHTKHACDQSVAETSFS